MDGKELGLEKRGFRWSEGYPTALELCMLEIENQPNLKAGGTKVIQHPSHFMIGNSVNGFCFNNDLSKNHKIGNVFSHFNVSIMDWICRLLSNRDLLE